VLDPLIYKKVQADLSLLQVPDRETPRRAVWATVFLSFCIACINFGPVVGFNAIVSLVICALTTSYTITISCAIWRRYFGAPLPKERFNLGIWGGPINIIALCCAAPVTVLSLFPSVPNPKPAYMNWACLVFGAIVIVAAINYAISGRKIFNPPMRKMYR
jgi:choline transport protein